MGSLTQAELMRGLPDALDYWRNWLDEGDENTLIAWQNAATAFAADCNRRLHELLRDTA